MAAAITFNSPKSTAMSEILRVYDNARCSKSRAACSLLEERGFTLEVVEYLKTPPSRAELAGLLRKLGVPAASIVRKGEDIYKTEYQGRELDEEQWLDCLLYTSRSGSA